MSKNLEAIVRISGDLDKSIQKALDGVADNLDKMEEAARKANGPVGELAGKIQDQSDVLEVAKKKYAGYVLSGEKGSKQAKDLKKKIEQLSGELNDNKEKLSLAENAAEQLAGGLEDAGDAARDTKGGFTVMKGALANLVSSGIENAISKAKEAAQALYGLAENTREYREDIGKLETAWQTAGKSTKLATATYKNFYSVLGEEDRSVEAVNHLAKFVNTERDMQKWTDICTGVWGTFGDSLPIEGLTEASNETAKVGKLTGVLADALNWAGVNEETFQASLDACGGETERAALITKTLNELYTDAAKNYRKNNASIIDARLAQSDYNDTLAAMGEKMEPVTTAVQSGLNTILTKALEVMNKVDFNAIADKIGPLAEKVIDLAENGFGKLKEAVGWVKDNMDWLLPVVTGLTTAFVAYKAISVAVAAYEAIKTAVLAAGATTMSIATVATWALNAAMAVLTSPILLVAAAIAAVIAIGVALYKNWDVVKEKAAQLGAWLSSTWANINASVSSALTNITSTISNAWTNIKTKVATMVANVKNVIVNAFDSLKAKMMAPFEAVIGIVENLSGKIGNVIGKIGEVGGNILNKIPFFASGGFTNGVSIAGEAGTEAIISFDPRYRAENLSYWAKAGRMLGADFSDFSGFTLTGASGGTYVDMGGVTFAPNITITGQADKQSIMEAIEEEYPEFIDLLEEWFAGRGLPVYG